MKILFVFTGGTIGSTLSQNVLSPDTKKSYKIIDEYSNKYAIDFDYDLVEPYTELSENNTGSTIKMLVDCVKDKINDGYDGIIVTHGTDTLQYSASALSYAFGLNCAPICLVASNKPIESEDSNAIDNLHGAIEFIKAKEGKGVFSVYRNAKEDKVFVHRGSRLIASKAYSDDSISIFDSIYGYFDSKFNFVKNSEYKEKSDEVAPLCVDNMQESCEEILLLTPHPGISYPEISDKVKCVVFNTYHSGTLDTKSKSALEFFEKAKEKGVKVFATGVYDGPEYESATVFSSLGIIPVKNLSPISVYVKLWMILLSNREVEDLFKSLSGDIA